MLVDSQFYSDLLSYIGAPMTEENLQFCETWQQREGGAAKWNPFNTTWRLTGSTDYNSAGVQNYPSSSLGIQATGKTLKMGFYTNLVAALQSGNPWTNPTAYAHALSVWSGGGYTFLVRPTQPVPLPPQGVDVLTPEQIQALDEIHTALLDPKIGLLVRVAKIETHLGIA